MSEDRQTGRLRNAKIKRLYLCAQCHSPLTEVWDESVECHLRVVCCRDHAHEGFVTKATVERREQQSRAEGQELRRIFPELSGYKEPTQAELAKDLSDLF